MSTTAQTLEADIRGTERAIRHLIGERAALNSKVKRAEAILRLEQARLAALLRPHGPQLVAGSRFPDVSNFQPIVDLSKVRNAGQVRVGALAFTKISEGLGFVDKFGPGRMRGMSANHFPRRGCYHFGHPSVSGVEQALHMLDALHAAGVVIRGNDIITWDAEVTDGEPPRIVEQVAHDFAVTIRKHTPAQLWLYSGGPFAQENGLTLDGFDAHWLAAYVFNPAPFKVFGARTAAWQFTDGRFGPNPHACPGIGSCDMSVVL